MLEALQLLHPEALNLPEHGEIPSFIGSLVSRAKKGKTGIPGTRAPPVPENVKKLIRDLDSDWAATNHKVMRGDKLVKYTMLDVYIHLKAAHDSSGSLDRFPTENQVKSYISSARKATRERNDPTASAILRQVAAGPKAGGGGRAKRKSKNPNPNQLKPKKRAPPKKKKSLAKRGGGDGSSSEDSLDDSNPDDEAEVPEDEPSTYVGM